MGKNMEHAAFLGEEPIYTVHYAADSRDFVVLLPPLFEELARTRRAYVNLARSLAREGFNVVRFDYYGSGMSRGDFSRFSLSRAEEDYRSVMAHCQSLGASRVSCVGFRFGGYLALRLASLCTGRIVLWEPILNLQRYLDDLFRSMIAMQMVTYGTIRYSKDDLMQQARQRGTVLIEGYPVSFKLIEELKQSEPCTILNMKEEAGKVSFLYWRNRQAYQEMHEKSGNAVFLDQPDLFWEHIKQITPEPRNLIQHTMNVLRDKS